MDEPLRPQFHYSAEKNMINDPNGLVFYQGEWHLFHQYNQHEVVHWGHAISTDLVRWRHQPPALFPNRHGQIYSGTAVVDRNNTSGLQAGPDAVLVAYFTFAGHRDGTQSQGMAYSNDRGRSWTMHPRNPIIPNPGRKDFRDPKVFRHEPSGAWFLVVTGGDHLEFFRSTNLLDWEFAFSWGEGEGAHGGVWECPDVFELPIPGSGGSRWVVSVSVDRGAPAGGSGMQYFVGQFDGHRFVNDNSPETVLWQNWGKDYYAGITWENAPAARRVMIAWADNWLYRFDIPTTPFNGQLTVPRELGLRSTPDGLRLHAQPVPELRSIRGRELASGGRAEVASGFLPLAEIGERYELEICLDVRGSTAEEFGVDLRVGSGQFTRVGFNRGRQCVFIDRSHAGVNPHPEFGGRHEAPVTTVDGQLRLRVLVDRSSVEVFTLTGVQLTDLILPVGDCSGWRVFAHEGVAVVDSYQVIELLPVWASEQERVDVDRGEWAHTVLGLQGSSPTRGIARLGQDDRITGTVEILGTRDGNPASLLGERAAGYVVGYDSGSGTGVAVLLDRENARASLIELPSGDELTSIAFPVQVNRRYLVEASLSEGVVSARIDGDLDLTAKVTRSHGPWTAAYVTNAEAVFNPHQPHQSNDRGALGDHHHRAQVTYQDAD